MAWPRRRWVALPFAMSLLGLSVNTATMAVVLAIATMGLNLCVGYTGLVSVRSRHLVRHRAYARG